LPDGTPTAESNRKCRRYPWNATPAGLFAELTALAEFFKEAFMKKLLPVAVAVFLLGIAGFAEEEKTSDSQNKGISISGVWTAQSFKTGGGFELGIPVYTGKGCEYRDFILVDGYGSREYDFGEFAIGNKFRFGGLVKANGFTIIPYGFVQIEAGLIINGESKLFQPPFSFSFGGGGGFELQFSKRTAFFVEYGGTGFYLLGDDSDCLSGGSITGGDLVSIGYRTYF
jgi:hypothetical protein